MPVRISSCLGGMALALALPAAALAQGVGTTPSSGVDYSDPRQDDKHWTVGLGAGAAPDYEGSEDYRAVPLWLVRYDDIYHPATYAQVFATQFKSNFLPDENWRLGLSMQFKPERDDVDNNQVDDMKSASESFLVGVVGGYDFILGEKRKIGAEIDARYDVANDNGYLITPKIDYEGALSQRWFINSGLSTTYASGDFMSNYFGVSANNAARSGLDEYDADADFKDVAVDLSFTYAFNESWSTSLIGQYKLLLNDAKDSPIVDDEGNENQLFGGVTVNWSF